VSKRKLPSAPKLRRRVLIAPEALSAPAKPEPHVTIQMEEICDTAWAAETARVILRAQARTAAREAVQAKEKRDDVS
jgi:hypothetical protein